MYEVKLTNRG